MNTSLASMMATVDGYFSRNTVGIVPFICAVDGNQLSSLNWWYKKQIQVIKWRKTLVDDIPNQKAMSNIFKSSLSFTRVKNNWLSGSSFVFRHHFPLDFDP